MKNESSTQNNNIMSNIVRKNQVPVWGTFFDDVLVKDLFNWNDKNFAEFGNTLPSVNVKETDSNYEIDLAAPGMKKDSFKISLDKNILTVSSENKSENEEKSEDGKYTRREFNYQSFSRSFTLPKDTVDSENIEANYVDGILKISVPKKVKEEAPVKTIEVK